MKKEYGQNFLINSKIIQEIICNAKITNKSNILEIGPGDGALTKEIIKKKPKNYIAVEIDTTLKEKLENIFKDTNYKLIFENALNFNEKKYFSKNTIVISNLPYNISIPLLIKWTRQSAQKKWCDKFILMFQKEVAERIISSENSKKYGRITLLCSAFFKIQKLLDVDKKSFYPVPKVDSSILIFKPLTKKKISYNDINILEKLSLLFFNNRRKKIKKKIQSLYSKKVIDENKLYDLFNLRAENLPPDTFYKLVKIY